MEQGHPRSEPEGAISAQRAALRIHNQSPTAIASIVNAK